jgi:catalase
VDDERDEGDALDVGTAVAARHKIDGGPSVLFDAVAVLPSADGAALLARDAAAKDFVADAFAHCKFIAHNAAARALFDAARVPARDAGFVPLSGGEDAAAFVAACRGLRLWSREAGVDLDPRPTDAAT